MDLEGGCEVAAGCWAGGSQTQSCCAESGGLVSRLAAGHPNPPLGRPPRGLLAMTGGRPPVEMDARECGERRAIPASVGVRLHRRTWCCESGDHPDQARSIPFRDCRSLVDSRETRGTAARGRRAAHELSAGSRVAKARRLRVMSRCRGSNRQVATRTPAADEASKRARQSARCRAAVQHGGE